MLRDRPESDLCEGYAPRNAREVQVFAQTVQAATSDKQGAAWQFAFVFKPQIQARLRALPKVFSFRVRFA
jgi:hypothetical protein